jgi:hypothetical protein
MHTSSLTLISSLQQEVRALANCRDAMEECEHESSALRAEAVAAEARLCAASSERDRLKKTASEQHAQLQFSTAEAQRLRAQVAALQGELANTRERLGETEQRALLAEAELRGARTSLDRERASGALAAEALHAEVATLHAHTESARADASAGPGSEGAAAAGLAPAMQIHPSPAAPQAAPVPVASQLWRQMLDASPLGFELLCGALFEARGYHVVHSGQAGDHGIDLRLTVRQKQQHRHGAAHGCGSAAAAAPQSGLLENGLHIVQCKQWCGKVGEEDVREAALTTDH